MKRLVLFVVAVCLTAAATAHGYWSGTAAAGSGATAATTVNAGGTPTASVDGRAVTVSWPARTTVSGQAVTGYEVRRYHAGTTALQTILSACTGTVAATSCTETNVPSGSWRYTVTPVLGTHWRSDESDLSAAVDIDATPPVNNLSLSVTTGGAALAGTTVHYRGATNGQLQLVNAVSDAGSGPASSATSSLLGTTTGWGHTGSTVSTPGTGPYVSAVFTWSTSTTSSPEVDVTGRDVAGNTAVTRLTFVNDGTQPSATLTYAAGYTSGRSVSVAFTASDAGSGVATDTARLQRSGAQLSSGTCGTFGTFVNLGSAEPSSPYNDRNLAGGRCYKYQYVVSDKVGNTRTVTGTNEVKVDYAAAVDATPGLLSLWRLGETSGTVAADSKGTRTGSYANGPTLGAAGAIAGDTNTATTFDGVNDYVQVTQANTTGIPVNTTDRSVEAWFRTSATSTRQVLFDYGSLGDAQHFGLWINAVGTSMTAWGWGGTHDKVFPLGKDVVDGQWHHVVQTFGSGTMTIYLDGVSVGSQQATRSTVMNSYGFVIGAVLTPDAVNAGGYFKGSLDEVALYNTVLTPATVTNHYELGTGVGGDSTGPTGGSVDATGLSGTGSRWSASTTLNLALAKGTDPSGISATGAELRRASASLTSTNGVVQGTCGAFTGYTTVVASNPGATVSNTVTDQACYRYQYSVEDTEGNVSSYTSPEIKVDTTAPGVPALGLAAVTSSYAAGSTVFYRPGTSGSFRVTPSGTDPGSGVAGYTYPPTGDGWTATAETGNVTYSWSGTPTARAWSFTAVNHAGSGSANASLTVTPDSTAPTAGSVTYPNTAQTTTTISVGFTTGTDSGSGIGTRLVQSATAPLTGTTCGTYGAFTTITGGTNPGTSPVVDTVTAGSCYLYQYVVTDRVGNQHTATNTNVVKVSTPSACGSQLVQNPGFESGGVGWTQAPTGIISTGSARTGTWKALLGGAGTAITRTLSQQVTVPAGCNASLSYYLQVSTNETSGPFDYFYVRVISGGTTSTVDTRTDRNSGAYAQRTVNLSAYAGQTITVVFTSVEDSSVVTTFLVDDVNLTTSPAPVGSYADLVGAMSGLVNWFRLGEAAGTGSAAVTDSFAGTTGATLQSRFGEHGATWNRLAMPDTNPPFTPNADVVITDEGRIRKNGSSYSAIYHASGAPATAAYTVSAAVHVKSVVPHDFTGVVGRLDPTVAAGTFYWARYETSGTGAGSFTLFKVVNGVHTYLGLHSQTLAVGSTTRLSLDMSGTTIRVLVDGVQRISVQDSSIAAAGRSGIAVGFGWDEPTQTSRTTTITNTTGVHLDSFRVAPASYLGLTDSKGTNHGDYHGGVTLGVAGAINGPANTAATFDGVDDYASFSRQVADNFSVEFWFKSTQGIGTGTQWFNGAALVDAEVGGITNDFGISLRSDGRIMAGVGNPDTTIVSPVGAVYNNGAWHHVVLTRTRSTGALVLYVNGAQVGTATGGVQSLTSAANITLGRIQAGTNFFAGSLDEVAIYSTALSPSDVSAHHAAR